MTPAEAAAILEVGVDASTDDIQRAYRRRARLSHPDLFVGSPAPDVAAAANSFVQAARARELLLVIAAQKEAKAAEEQPYRGDSGATAYDLEGLRGTRRRPSWWVFGAWTGLLIVGVVISYLGGPFPESPLDLVLRLAPLAVSAIAFAISGRRFWFLATGVFLALSAVLTFVLASFGSLLALQFLLVPVIGLGALGRTRMPRR